MPDLSGVISVWKDGREGGIERKGASRKLSACRIGIKKVGGINCYPPIHQTSGRENQGDYNLRRNQVWVGDITYVRLKEQFVYVAVLMDGFTRMIRGWQMSRHLTQPLTLRPLQQALSQSVPEIHHSDQGVEYLSTTYISTLMSHGIEISLAHRGRPWENGYAERLIRTLKEEEVQLNDYEDMMEAK